MTGAERVMTAIGRRVEPDRVPWGELGIEPAAAKRLLEEMGRRPATGDSSNGPLAFEDEAELIHALGMDVAPVAARPLGAADARPDRGFEGWFERRIRRYRLETDLFVLFITGGGFYQCMSAMGFERFLAGLRARSREVEEAIALAVEENTALARRAAAAGAHGILVGDDIAYSCSTYASPRDLRAVLFPRLADMAGRIKELGCVPLFHSDGNLNAVLDDIISAGFEVVHSLEPSAGMDLAALKARYGGRVCLMGNIEIERLAARPPSDVRRAVLEAVAAAARGGGFILSTSSGVIRREIPTAHVLAMSEAVAARHSTEIAPTGQESAASRQQPES